MGGLGNQMLQYALGRQLSIKHKTSLWLDLSWYENNEVLAHPRTFKLDRFHAEYHQVNFEKLSWKLRYTSHFSCINPYQLKLVKEKDISVFDAAVMEAGNNIILEGFFPAYQYFKGIRPRLLKEFIPIEQMDAKNAACLQEIKASNAVSVHVRRGDYALTDFHGLLGKEYYESAIQIISQRIGELRLFIFSDEPEWVLNNMQFNYPFEMIHFNGDEHNYFDMELMKHCKHHIIANSSFSWWPAWLNDNPGKIVVAPKKWNNQGTATSKLVPADWALI